MINGQLSTWFVVKWLKEHPEHTASAPETDLMHKMSAKWLSFDGISIGAALTVIDDDHTDGLYACDVTPDRRDWTIYRADGKPVRFKQRNRLEHVGVMRGVECLHSVHARTLIIRPLRYAKPDQEFDVYVRERPRKGGA